MSRVRGLVVVGAAVVSALASVAAQPPRMNVLFLIADDLNNMVGCYGDSMVKSPNIDRLAERGVRFERAYCQFPLCGPSRNSFLTGLYPDTTGILRNRDVFRQTIPDHVSLPQAFRLAGGWAVRIGKLYHYGVPVSIGTSGNDDPASWEVQFNPAGVDRLLEEPDIFSLVPGQFGGTLSWYASPHGDLLHTDGILATEAAWVLERAAREPHRPFFLAVGFYRPHTPFVAPRRYFDLYPTNAMPIVEGVEEDQRDIPAAALMSRTREQDHLTDELRRQCRQAYLASITFMDAQVGRVLDELDRRGLATNTVIVFTSDHGYHLGEHGLWQKMSLFEESARVPLIIVAPGVTVPGGVVRSPVSLVDLYPTLAELCGVRAPTNLQGQSLVPMLRDPSQRGRGWALTQVTRSRRVRAADGSGMTNATFFGYSIRTDRWRYTEWDGGREGRELYDHEQDPRELANLAENPVYAATVAELSARLRMAVQSCRPPNGERPRVPPGELWYPRLAPPAE